MDCLLTDIIKNPNYELYAEEYYLGTDFYSNGSARLNGILWTPYCGDFNLSLSRSSLSGDRVDIQPFLNYIENTIFTFSNFEDIKFALNGNNEEALLLHQLVCKHQIQDNVPFHHLPLPSDHCFFRQKPDETAVENIFAAKLFLKHCKENLVNLSQQDKKNLDTHQWLDNLNVHFTFQLLNDDNLEVKFADKTVQFIIDENLNEKITVNGVLKGVYYYSLATSDKEYSLVLKRSRILDVYTRPYNFTLLKAFGNKIEIVPLYTETSWWSFVEKFSPVLPNLDNTEIECHLEDHSLVTIPEFISLHDVKRSCDVYSAPTVFISTHEKSKPKFRKVAIRTDDAFVSRDQGYYVELASNLIRHQRRLNGKNLLLIESCLWYELIPGQRGRDLFDVYKDNLNNIPTGDIVGVAGDNLPTYLLSSNSQIMKLRKRRKVMKTPSFTYLSREFKISQVFLFYPLKPNAHIDFNRIGNI